jgi:hypothetical protein
MFWFTIFWLCAFVMFACFWSLPLCFVSIFDLVVSVFCALRALHHFHKI